MCVAIFYGHKALATRRNNAQPVSTDALTDAFVGGNSSALSVCERKGSSKDCSRVAREWCVTALTRKLLFMYRVWHLQLPVVPVLAGYQALFWEMPNCWLFAGISESCRRGTNIFCLVVVGKRRSGWTRRWNVLQRRRGRVAYKRRWNSCRRCLRRVAGNEKSSSPVSMTRRMPYLHRWCPNACSGVNTLSRVDGDFCCSSVTRVWCRNA